MAQEPALGPGRADGQSDGVKQGYDSVAPGGILTQQGPGLQGKCGDHGGFSSAAHFHRR